MRPVSKPTWQQATALVSLSTCGAMTGFSFAHGTVADMTSPTGMPAHLLEFVKPIRPASGSARASASDSSLRAAIINVASYYLRMAQNKTPAQMEALIWQGDSIDGADHGESCAAFASLTLALGAQAAGQESWVTGGSTYPWPLHAWADVRVAENSSSPGVISIQQDAQAHDRWHPLGDGYQPQPGDWVLFDGHVEVVTKYANRVLSTIGGDSLPNFTVNAHQFSAPLGAQGVIGFVNNGELSGGGNPAGRGSGIGSGPSAANAAGAASYARAAGPLAGAAQELAGSVGSQSPGQAGRGGAAVPGTLVADLSGDDARSTGAAAAKPPQQRPAAATPAAGAGGPRGAATIPGLQAIQADLTGASPVAATPANRRPAPAYGRAGQSAAGAAAVPDTSAQQAFISQVAPGAVAAQGRYGIPASVTIAQAIEESGWGQSVLAVKDHNLFGIKGSGPAGADIQPTQEYVNGSWVTVSAAFKVYHNIAESIADHSQLLATGESYQQAMADKQVPDAFAADLTGVYATDPNYGSNLIALMRLYNLYRYGTSAQATPHEVSSGAAASGNGGGTASGLGTSSGLGTVGQGGTAGEGAATSAGGATIPGVLDAYVTAAAKAAPDASVSAGSVPKTLHRPSPRITARRPRAGASRFVSQIPRTVTADFIQTAKAPLTRAEPLYRDVAHHSGMRWELLAACDWMQCKAQPRLSPVHGEKLGTTNADGTSYRTRSEALAQAAGDLIELAMAVYWIDITARRPLSVRKLASVFAAFRWGGLLKLHNISAMEFPYSVAGLTAENIKMRWPDVKEPNAPDKPGSRFRGSFGAVPVVLSLDYPAMDE